MATDREFQDKLSDLTHDCLKTRDEEFAVLQHKFDEIIQELPAFGPSLARIKLEYEKVLKIITDTSRVRALINLDQDKHMSEKQTYKNYSKRKLELEDKIVQLLAENEKLRNDIAIARDICALRLEEKKRRESPYHIRFPLSSANRRSLRLSTKDSIDVSFLENELNRLKHELEDIQFKTEKRFVPMSTKVNLQHQLMEKEKERERLEKKNSYLTHLYLQLSHSIKAAKAYYASATTHGMPPITLTDYIFQSLVPVTFTDVNSFLGCLTEENAEEEKEAEFILNCCQRFNELFINEKYEEAALIAATSPQGVLRTIETLYKFKQVAGLTPSPLMLYCSALMDTASTYPPVSLEESQECLECAVNQNDVKSIAKWINQDSLSLSKDMGVYLYQNCCCQKNCQCRYCMLALVVFRKLDCHFEECLCLAKLGKYNALLAIIKNQNYSKHDIASLLASIPSPDLALCLTAPPVNYKPFLHLFEALFVLADSSGPEFCEELVKSYALLKHSSLQETLQQETQLRPDLVSSLIPILSKSPKLSWMVEHLTVYYIISTVVSNALARVNNSMSLRSNSLTSSSTYSNRTHSNSSSRPKLVRSQRFDEDDGEDDPSVQSDSRTSSPGSNAGTQSISGNETDES